MQNRLTIKDIARLSGVGKSTVSRVLNNEGSVSPQTRERVEAVIRQQGFTPSKSARAMRGQSDKVVGIIVSRLDSPSENQAVRTMLPLLYQQGFDPIVMESQFETRLVQEHLHVLHQRNVGYLGVQLSDATTGQRRYQAYLNACERLTLTPRATLGELSYQSGFQHAAEVIDAHTSALICASDSIALGAIKYLQQQPARAIQVCAIGNTPLLSFLFPDTLSVEFGYGSAGLLAAQQLLAQLSGEQGIRRLVVPSKLS